MTDYQGGDFYIRPAFEDEGRDGGAGPKYPVKPTQYSAVVFLSHNYHGVESIEFLSNAKGRHMWANESWAVPYDPPFGVLRPTLESMEHFLHLQPQPQSGDNDFPQRIETGAWLLGQGRELLVDGKDAPEYYQDDQEESQDGDEEASQDEDEESQGEEEDASQDEEDSLENTTEL